MSRWIFYVWNIFSTAPIKILYTDYDNAIVLYVCLEVDYGGHCVPGYQRIFMMGRKPSLNPELRSHLNDVVRGACFDPDELKDADGTCKYYVPLILCLLIY